MMLNALLRQRQFEQLENGLKVIGYLVRTISHEEATGYRDGGRGWTVQEVLGHLLDYEEIFLQRARMTVEQEHPVLPAPEQDELVTRGNFNAQDIDDMVMRWQGHRRAFLAYLAERSETDWDSVGTHPRRGDMTLEGQLLLIVWHDMNHMEQITHILSEKQTGET